VSGLRNGILEGAVVQEQCYKNLDL